MSNSPRRARLIARIVASLEYDLTEPVAGVPAPPWPEGDPFVVCACGHTSIWHQRGFGPCGALAVGDIRCPCPVLEPDLED